MLILSLMFRINNTVESRISHKESVSLLDSGLLGSKEMTKSQMYDEQLKDLIAFDGVVESSDNADMISEQEDYSESRDGVSSEGNQTIDNMIKASIMGFEEQAQKASLEEPLLTSSGLVKRR